MVLKDSTAAILPQGRIRCALIRVVQNMSCVYLYFVWRYSIIRMSEAYSAGWIRKSIPPRTNCVVYPLPSCLSRSAAVGGRLITTGRLSGVKSRLAVQRLTLEGAKGKRGQPDHIPLLHRQDHWRSSGLGGAKQAGKSQSSRGIGGTSRERMRSLGQVKRR